MKTPATSSASTAAAAAPVAASAAFRVRPPILLFGDSLTQFGFGIATATSVDSGQAQAKDRVVKEYNVGWASLLSSAYTRRADVLNRGFSGYNSRHAVELLLPRVFTGPYPTSPTLVSAAASPPQPRPLFCTVFFGANDAALPGEPQHVPVDEYVDNIGRIVTGIRASMTVIDKNAASTTPQREGATAADPADPYSFPIILMTPPPVHEKSWVNFREDLEESDRTNEVTRNYGLRLIDEVQKSGLDDGIRSTYRNCQVLDTWTLLDGDSEERKVYLSDGLHLNASGNIRVYEGLMELLREKYPCLCPMDDDDGEGKYGKRGGIPVEEPIWKELVDGVEMNLN